MSTKRKLFAYIRVSTTRQGKNGVSLQEQKDSIERYAERNGISISGWFEEQETAARRGRPVFGRMLRELGEGLATGVIIHKIDRGARNLKDWADLGELIDQGIEVHCANESLDMGSRGGRLAADIQAVVAADYIRNLREETKKGFYGRLKQGLYPLPAPIGYLDCGKGIPKKPDPVRASLIEKLFVLYATGRYSLHRLRAEATRMGLTNRRGNELSLNGISTILRNRFYIGVIYLKSTDEYFNGIHDPLVTPKLFEKVQVMLSGRTVNRKSIHDFLFRRMLTCHYCGYSLIGEKQKGHVYYRCHSKGCQTKCVREEEVEKVVGIMLQDIDLDDAEKSDILTMLAEHEQARDEAKSKMLKLNQLHLDRHTEKLDRLLDILSDDVIDVETFKRRQFKLLKKIKTFEARIRDIETGINPVYRCVADFLEQSFTAPLTYNTGILSEKREILEFITSNRVVKGKEVLVEPPQSIQILCSGSNVLSGDPYRGATRTSEEIVKELVEHFSSESENGE